MNARKRYVCSLVMSVTFTIPWLLATTCSAQDWRQFGGPNGNFRVVAAESGTSSSNPIVPWSRALQAGDAAPVVAGERVIVAEAAFTNDGLDAHAIHCLRLGTGESLWRTLLPEQSYVSQDISDRYPVRPLASCAVMNDKVFALGFGGSLRCLRLEDGAVVWQRDLVAEFGATPLQFGFASSPWCDKRQVIVACGGKDALIIAFSQDQGTVLWKLSAGELGYGGFCQLQFASTDAASSADPPAALAYMARDQVIAFDSQSGKELWSYQLPKPGLTNAVTPLQMPNQRLLIGGQGAGGSILLEYGNADAKTSPSVIWTNARAMPFYCNWLTNPAASQALGTGGVLAALNLADGDVLWQKRGWTDANFAWTGELLVGVRGDGVAATAKWNDDGVAVESVQLVAKDRVWAPPVLVGNRLLVRGRNSIACVDWSRFPQATKLPTGTEVDAMTAMYGTLPEKVEALRMQATTSPGNMNFSDYQQVASDRSVFLGEGDFIAILDGLEAGGNQELARQIATDWAGREPFSVAAFERMLRLKAGEGQVDEVDSLKQKRLVTVTFSVTVPSTTPSNAQVFITGNCTALGNWKPQSLLLERQVSGIYSATAQVPQGDLQFKCTLGSWEKEEKRADGRSISNRRRRVLSSCNIDIEVARWAAIE